MDLTHWTSLFQIYGPVLWYLKNPDYLKLILDFFTTDYRSREKEYFIQFKQLTKQQQPVSFSLTIPINQYAPLLI